MTIEILRAKGLILFEVIAGSKAYGLSTAGSDTDIKGVYYLPKADFYAGEYVSQVADEKNDVVYYELGRFFELLAKSNPTVLEMLASPKNCIRYAHPLFEDLRMDDYLSLAAVDTFVNYAMRQVYKAKGLNKKINNPVAKKRKTLMDFCYVLQGVDAVPLVLYLESKGWTQENCGLAKLEHCKDTYGLYYNSPSVTYKGILRKEDSSEVNCSSIPKGEKLEAYLVVNHDAFAQYCKAYREYFEWEANRNQKRFQSNLENNAGYDAKNMMHTLRLLEVAKEILVQGVLNVRRTNRAELLEIKNGVYSYDELAMKAKVLQDEILACRESSPLRKTINKELWRHELLTMRSILYK